MEPPAVTSCGVGSHSSAGGGSGGQQHNQTPKRNNLPISFLQIEPQISFNTSTRHFEELPENFLETISPQQHADGLLGNSINSHDGRCEGTTAGIPQLASLTTVSMAGGGSTVCVQGSSSSGYTNLISMSNSPHYISSLKMESIDQLDATHHQLHGTSQIDKTTFGNGTAGGLLSPLQLESNRNSALGILANSVVHHHHHRTNGGGSRTSDLLSGIRRSNNVSYIKEEDPSEMGSGGYQSTSHDYETGYTLGGQPTAQELERMANAETPPALSNVEITSSLLASLSRESQSSPQPTHFIVHQMAHHSRPPPSVGPSQQISHQQQNLQQRLTIQQHLVHPGNAPTPAAIVSPMSAPRRSNKSKMSQNQQQQHLLQQQQQEAVVHHQLAAAAAQEAAANNPINIDVYAALGSELASGIMSPSYHHSSGAVDPLNAEIDDEIYIDTKDLCKRVAYELKQHSIPQAIFAERILCRSQGTLSDLLRNPKPWNRLKSGRETFKRMYNWLQQPLHIRLSILDMYKEGPMPSGIIPPPTPAQNSRHHHRRRSAGEDGQPLKRPRLVFTDIQKRTLQAIFKETQRPSREMQQTIAEHLRLDMSTVSNFFMNARRRSRNGNGLGCDEPAPYQQIRTITPPPDTPPTNEQQQQQFDDDLDESDQQLLDEHSPQNIQEQTIQPKSSPMSAAPSSAENLNLIEQTVDEVVCRSIAYARKSP